VAGTKISTQQELIGMGLNMVKVPMDRAQPGNYVLKVTMKETTQIVQVIKL
jgi:hypothetical protein